MDTLIFFQKDLILSHIQEKPAEKTKIGLKGQQGLWPRVQLRCLVVRGGVQAPGVLRTLLVSSP